MEKDVAILMADLTGYTAMTHVHGGASAAKIVHKYLQLVDRARVGTSKVVQRIGDQVVLIADDANDMLATARRLNQLTIDESHFLSIHAGLHYGSIFIENGNLFGSTINIAARIMNLANRGQILCSNDFRSQLQDQTIFKTIGTHRLKNVMEEIELFQLSPLEESIPLPIDPVCHMHIDPNKSTYSFRLNDTTYHFCSEHCMLLFKNAPQSFIADV